MYDRVLDRPLTRVEGITAARGSTRVPVVLSQREIRSIFAHLDDPVRLAAALMYGSGLRLMECIRLRIKDVDADRMEITVRRGKGGKDCRMPLARTCLGSLKRMLRARREQFRRDRKADVRVTELPDALTRKYPNADSDWSWHIYSRRHGVTTSSGTRFFRHHLHETLVQRRFREAVLAAGIPKRASCHTLRHSFATHFA